MARTFEFQHRTLCITAGDLKILHATARRMIVRIDAQWIRMIVVICHAPSSGDFDEALAFWNATTNAIPKRFGSSALKEHPRVPIDEAKASTWRTQLHRKMMMALHGASEHHFQQWKFGAPSVKPTTLCAIGLNKRETWATIKSLQLPNMAYPHTSSALGGVAEDGQFKTAAAKVGIIANDATRRINGGDYQEIREDSLSVDEKSWLARVLEIGQVIHRTTWMADYQPRV